MDVWRQHAVLALEWLGTAAFAISGVLSAMRKRMDVVGICVCGFLTAFGGGTLRDVLIDRRPFFWVENPAVLLATLALCVALALFIRQSHLERGARWLDIPDAIGLGLFCATGVELSWVSGQPALVTILMGVITATFGGVLRDMVANEIPTLFRDHRPYAICAALGALTYVGLAQANAPEGMPLAVCAGVTTFTRWLALRRDWRLPPIKN